MITYVKGDIFSSPSKIIVNTVNTVGIMGKGVALEFKNRYPDMFQSYKALCDEKKLDVGKLVLWKNSSKWVLLFPTKRHWRNPSKMEYIEKGLMKFVENWDKLGANSIAFPRLGCGNGGLDWEAVRPLMEKYLNPLPLQILIYVDNYNDPKPEHEDITEIEKWIAGGGGLIGYEKFRAQMRNCIAHNKEFELPSGKYMLKEESGLIYINEICIEEQLICNFWNWVKDVGIVMPKDVPTEFHSISDVMLSIMYKLNYISEIIISEDGVNFSTKSNGYQYIMG